MAVITLSHLAPIPIRSVSLLKLSRVVVPIYARLGMWTGKRRSEVLSSPIGKVVVASVCSLARHGRSLQRVHQGEDRCVATGFPSS